MKQKYALISFRPSQKLRIYLERLGYLDGRSGKQIKGKNIANLINTSIIKYFEQETNGNGATSQDLHRMWAKYQIGIINHKMEKLNQKRAIIMKEMPENREIRENLHKLI